MQSLRRCAQNAAGRVLMAGRRAMSTAEPSAEAQWSNYFPKPKAISADAAKKSLRKEMIGLMILGPAATAFMLYDLVVGLEEEHEVVIPPYPWMRIRRVPGMPWGEDSLFEYHPRVASQWPPEGGIPEDTHQH